MTYKMELNANEQKHTEHRKRNFKEFSHNTGTNNKFEGDGEKPDWKKVKKERKDLKEKRKIQSAGGNDIYEVGVKLKKLWEEVRRDNCKDARKNQLCSEIYSLVKGKVKSFIYAHDLVRVIETLVSAGGEKYRTLLYEELKGDILELSKNKYSRFFSMKLLKYGTKQQKDAIIGAMRGRVVELFRHKIACEIIELAYNDYANAKQRSSMIQEFYGSQFKYFKEDIVDLESAIKLHPDKKDVILTSVFKILQPIIDKGVFTNTLIHTMLKDFLYICGETERRSVLDSIKEHLLPILHTRDGSRVAMLCLWYGTAKDRKLILKSLKDNFVKIALEEHGHMFLLAAFDCVDDTVIVTKAVLSELMEGLNVLIENENGRKVLKYLVAPRSKLFFHPDILKILSQGDEIGSYKKDRSVKYEAYQKEVSAPILKLIRDKIDIYARFSQWTLFVGSALQSLYSEDVESIFQSLADICNVSYSPEASDHFLEVSYMCKMISFIITCDKQRHQQGKPIFSNFLVSTAEAHLESWCSSNRGCFILVKIIETDVQDVVQRVKAFSKSLINKLTKLDSPGAKILLLKLKDD